ncbi:MAG: thiamine pyrophosphate-binding protein [Candidatus Latescibacterota bacterium]
MNGAQLFVACLQAQGVEWISTLCGNGLNGILAACRQAGVRRVDTRNEQTAAYMAEAWGRLSGRVGVCAVSSGVAHANAMTGVVNACFDGAPMLLVTGAGPRRTAGRGHFQDLDQVALAAPVCKYACTLDQAERIPEYVYQAFAAALSARPGPVHLTFPMDVQEALVEGVEPAPAVLRQAGAPAPAAAVARAVDLLARAQRPVLVCGSGVFYSGGEEAAMALAAAYGIPLVVPIWDRGCVGRPCGEYLGVVGAASGGPRLLEDADLVLLAGAEVDYRVGYLQSPPLGGDLRVVRIQPDPARAARCRVDVDLLADPGTALAQVQEACTGRQIRGFEAWLAEAQQRQARFAEGLRVAPAQGDGRLPGPEVMAVLEEVLPPEAVLIVDGGNVGQWFHQTLGRRRYPGHWLTCGASGVVGNGIGAAMAARTGFAHRPVVLLSGDGAATFNLPDLERAAAQGLPFVMLIADDEAWGIVEVGHRRQYGEPLNSALGPIDFAALAQSLGALGTRVSSRGELERALRQGMGERLPAVIHVPVTGGFPGG